MAKCSVHKEILFIFYVPKAIICVIKYLLQSLARNFFLFLLQIIKIGTLQLVFSNSCLTYHTRKNVQQFTLKTV